MRKYPRFFRTCGVTLLALCFTAICSAGTISRNAAANLTIADDLLARDLELEFLGFDPSMFFFFTGNTAYAENGINELEIIAAAINPSGATSLSGVTTHQIEMAIDDSGYVSVMSGMPAQSLPTVPEPATGIWGLLATGLVYGRRRLDGLRAN